MKTPSIMGNQVRHAFILAHIAAIVEQTQALDIQQDYRDQLVHLIAGFIACFEPLNEDEETPGPKKKSERSANSTLTPDRMAS